MLNLGSANYKVSPKHRNAEIILDGASRIIVLYLGSANYKVSPKHTKCRNYPGRVQDNYAGPVQHKNVILDASSILSWTLRPG